MLRSKKALSLIIASIILIAVTVAVSIAVAAWMGALTFSFMKVKPSEIKVAPIFLEPNTINVTITNKGPSIIYPENLLIDNVTVWPVVVIDNLSVGKSKISVIEYNWTYDTSYKFTFVWLDNNKESNYSVRFTSPHKLTKGSMTIDIPLVKEFSNSDNPYVNAGMWQWDSWIRAVPIA